jgi:hypothetical protein
MPYYLSDDREGDAQTQRRDWTEIARYVRSIDPMHRPITTHPTRVGRDQVEDDSVLDVEMHQCGHNGREALPNMVRFVRDSVRKEPAMPVVVGEIIYEGIMHDSHDDMQRLAWWAAMLSGAAGYTYGANGIWQVNQVDRPYGPSPHGGNWGLTPWREAARLPGSTHLGLSARYLSRFDWSAMEPHPEWVQPGAADEYRHYAAGVSREFRIFYFYAPVVPRGDDRPRVVDLDTDLYWRGEWFNPRTGVVTDIGPIEVDSEGTWLVTRGPEQRDMVIAVVADSGESSSRSTHLQP